jgi:hypothetical protein
MANPQTGLATDADAELADLERLWQSLELPGYRVELIDGQIVVSPTASRGHSNVVTELIDQLADVKLGRWERRPAAGLGALLAGRRDDVDAGLLALGRGDRRGRAGERVEPGRGLRERDHVADRVAAGQQHH